MDQTFLRLNRKLLCVLGILSVLLLIEGSNAYEFKVGGPKGSWAVPSDPNAASYNKWAEMNRFQIGDTLLFVYQADKDSVLEVTKDDYTSCNTAEPIAKFSDGHTAFKFKQSGPYYFISGVGDNCHKNEKLTVIVMANRSNHSSPPSPSPATSPSGQESPSPVGVEINPAPAPDHKSRTNNGSALVDMSVIGSIGTFLGSLILLLVS